MRISRGLKPLAPRLDKRGSYNDEVRGSFSHSNRHGGGNNENQQDSKADDRARHNDNIDYHREDVPDRPRRKDKRKAEDDQPKTESNVKETVDPMTRNQHIDDPNIKTDEWGRVLSTPTNIADEKQ